MRWCRCGRAALALRRRFRIRRRRTRGRGSGPGWPTRAPIRPVTNCRNLWSTAAKRQKKKFYYVKKIFIKIYETATFSPDERQPAVKQTAPGRQGRQNLDCSKIVCVLFLEQKRLELRPPPFSVAAVPAAPIKGREIWFSLAYNPFNLFSPLCAVIDSDGNNWRNVFTTSTWSIQGEMNQILFLEIIKSAEDGA